jgi:hypothetical protein
MSDPLGIIYGIRIASPTGVMSWQDSGGVRPEVEAARVAMAETGWRRARADSGIHTRLSARLGFGALSLADPMGPPASVISGRGNAPKGTPGHPDLSSGSEDSLPAWDRTRLLQAGQHPGDPRIQPYAGYYADLNGVLEDDRSRIARLSRSARTGNVVFSPDWRQRRSIAPL